MVLNEDIRLVSSYSSPGYIYRYSCVSSVLIVQCSVTMEKFEEIQGSAEQKLLLCLMEQVNKLTYELSN